MSAPADQELSEPLGPAAMDCYPCVVCAFDIVDDAYEFDCGHRIHSGCFDLFMQIESLQCRRCAEAQWYYSGGYPE